MGGAKGAVAPLTFTGEKIESFVAFTRNLIPKSLGTHHFLDKILQFDFLGLKNVIFSKFCPRAAWNFTFSSRNLKLNLREMHFLGLKDAIFSKFCP